MNKTDDHSETKISPIKRVFPQLNQQELEDAEFRLNRYIRIVRRIFERIKRERPEILTELEKRARLRKQRQIGKKEYKSPAAKPSKKSSH